MEGGKELRLEVKRGRKEWSTVASTTVRRWMLSGDSGPVWKREIIFKNHWCDINIETYIVDRTQKNISPENKDIKKNSPPELEKQVDERKPSRRRRCNKHRAWESISNV